MLEGDNPRGAEHQVEEASFNRKKMKFVARRVVVKLAAPETSESMADVMQDVCDVIENSRQLRSASATGRMVLVVPDGLSVRECVKKVEKHASVTYAEPDFLDYAQIVPNDPRYFQQWGPPLVNAEDAWDLEVGGGNVVIGIVDSGISMTGGVLDHDDLSDTSRISLGTDFVDGGTPRDLHGHGTHVAGIAGASTDNTAGVAGMNWSSPMYITRVFDANRSGSSADFADAVEEITDWALANDLKAVINYSGGGPDNLTKRDACQYASDNGMLLVAAAGNDNGGAVIFPAAYSTTISGVVAVGSTDDDDTVSSFSNIGPEVTVVAPGRAIHSTFPTYGVTGTASLNYGDMSGTSMAAPLVSGLAALMWSRHPGHTAAKIKECLSSSAVKLGSGNFNNSWGNGRVDALAALKCGDPVIVLSNIGTCPTRIVSACQIVTKLKQCLVVSAVCPTTRIWCPSKVISCQVSKLSCPSRLPHLCRTRTLLTNCDPRSLVDGCPSTPGGCVPDFRRIDPIDARIRRIESLFGLETEAWYGDADGASDDDSDGWFYVDDDGNIHEL